MNGILLVDKTKGSTAFRLVALLRRLTKVEKIGHSGTLDPFATGLMVMLIGRDFTKRSDEFLTADKEYEAVLHLGVATDTYDLEGAITAKSDLIPSLRDIETVIESFQGDIQQVPPMYSAKKVKGQKLYDLARKGITIERKAAQVHVEIKILSYEYPELKIHVHCSKGTYIRSLAHDIGNTLGTGAHLSSLIRLRSGTFHIIDAIPQILLQKPDFDVTPYLRPCP